LPSSASFCDFCGSPVGGVQGSRGEAGGPPASPATSPDSTGRQSAATLEFLGKLPIFQYLERQVLWRFADQIRLVSLPEGPVFREGDAADGLYIIRSGAARVTKVAEGGGPEAVMAILGQGDSFGEIGLIDGLPRSANVTAMQPMECYFLARDVFSSLLDQHPEVARSLLRAMANMVRHADEWVASTI
jgi:CRP/FNR family cyclic AMP-dependent transcriptional regulator